MPIQALRLTAFCAYLFAWLVFAIGAAASFVPRIQKEGGLPTRLKPAVAIGALLQICAILTITLHLSHGPLRPKPSELVAVALLAPFAAALFVWSLLSAPRHAGPNSLVTQG